MKKNSYIAIAFVILLFGIWAVPKIVARFEKRELIKFEAVVPFEFENHNGVMITNKDMDDKVYVVEFFFTSCPTICPKMNDNLVKVQNEYFGNPDFGILSVTIDPKRDSPEVLKAYAQKKGATLKNWHFLTGEIDDIYEFSNDGFKLYAGENKDVEGGFEHSGLFALIDKDGFIRSRTVMNGGIENPIKFYNGLEDREIQWLKEDIAILLKE